MSLADAPPVIETRGLAKRYRRVTALADGTITVPRRDRDRGPAPRRLDSPPVPAEGACLMDTDDRGFPRGHLRVSDADRDRALAELTAAVQVGRITAGEFDERSGQVLGARTGSELTVPLADLPVGHAPADVARPPAARPLAARPPARRPRSRVVIASAVAASCFAAVAVAHALQPRPTLQQREVLQQLMARQGISVPLPPSPGFDWAGTLIPGAVAVLLVVLMIFLSVTRAARADRA